MTEDAQLPRVSVVIETITARYDTSGTRSLLDDVAATLTALERQSYPPELIEPILVVDEQVATGVTDELGRRFPSVRFAKCRDTNYFAAKNAGVEAAQGSIVAMLDSDCEPGVQWLERLVARLQPGVAAVAGRTRYRGGSLWARTLSVPGFGYVLTDKFGAATGFHINNVAFAREVIREWPFDARIRRNGGCVLLYHQLRAAGMQVLYEPGAQTAHATDDVRGLGFVRKQFGRGYDCVATYRLDERGVLQGTRLFRRLGGIAVVPITARRILRDWARIARYRRQIGVRTLAIPYFAAVAAGLRLIELFGMFAALGPCASGPRTPSSPDQGGPKSASWR